MEAPPQHGISRSLIAAAIGAIVMAAAVVGISLNTNAGTTTIGPAESAEETTVPTTTEAPADADADVPATTTASFDEAMATEMAYDEDYFEYEQCMQESGVYDMEMHDGPDSEEDYEAMDAAWEEADAECSLLLPEEIQIENAAWKAHSECVEDKVGEDFWESEESHNDREAMEFYEQADRECRSLLPQDIQDELAAWDEHSACTEDFLGEEAFYGESGDTVSYSTYDEYASYILGDGDSTITITKVDGEVSINVEGDVIVQDEEFWAAEEAKWMEAEEACGHLAPEYSEG